MELVCSAAAAGVNLRHAVGTPFAPVEFQGDWRTDCRLLGGEVQVLNVMTRRGRAKADIRVRRWTGALLCEQRPGETLLAVMLTGRALIGGEAAPLVPNDAVMLESRSGGHCEIEAAGTGARIAIVRFTRP